MGDEEGGDEVAENIGGAGFGGAVRQCEAGKGAGGDSAGGSGGCGAVMSVIFVAVHLLAFYHPHIRLRLLKHANDAANQRAPVDRNHTILLPSHRGAPHQQPGYIVLTRAASGSLGKLLEKWLGTISDVLTRMTI